MGLSSSLCPLSSLLNLICSVSYSSSASRGKERIKQREKVTAQGGLLESHKGPSKIQNNTMRSAQVRVLEGRTKDFYAKKNEEINMSR